MNEQEHRLSVGELWLRSVISSLLEKTKVRRWINDRIIIVGNFDFNNNYYKVIYIYNSKPI